MSRSSISAIALSLALVGCGTTPADRAVSGTGLGAGAGAVVGALTGLSVLEGAALGGIAGGLTGVLTDPGRVNLGAPVWKRGEAAASNTSYAHNSGGGTNSTVGRIQAGLSRLGFRPGPIDGV